MSFSTKCAEALIWMYKGVNRLGWLDNKLARSLYISSYFTYKKYIEDPFAKLTKHYAHVFQGGNILDIGANIGYTSYVFSKLIQNPFKIIAFEPETRNIEILKQAGKKFRFQEHLISVSAAVGDYDGEINLWRNDAHNGDHRILTDELKNQLPDSIQIQRTPIVMIDTFLQNYSPKAPVAFIKIDVQGYELAVCKGMQKTLENNPDSVVAFEYCPSVIEALGFNPKDLLHYFKNRGYQFFVLNKNNRLESYDTEKGEQYLRQIRPHDYIDILCARRNLAVS